MPKETSTLALLENNRMIKSEPLSNSENGYLKNGDTVAYKWTIDPQLEAYIGAKIIATDGEFQVTSLIQGPSFDGIEVTFLGSNGDGTANVLYTGELLTPCDSRRRIRKSSQMAMK